MWHIHKEKCMKHKGTVRQKSLRITHTNLSHTKIITGMLSPSLISSVPDHSSDHYSLNDVVELSLPCKFRERWTWSMHYYLSGSFLHINDPQEIQPACYPEWSAFRFYFHWKFYWMDGWIWTVFILFQKVFGAVFWAILRSTVLCLLVFWILCIHASLEYMYASHKTGLICLCFSHENA